MTRHAPEEVDEAGPLFAFARRTDPDTSGAAAASLDSKALGELTLRVLEAIRASGAAGLTTIDLEDRLHVQRVSVSPRIKPLVDRHLIEDSGQRRIGPSGRPSIVWTAKEGSPP